jgi:hypothetical protein
VGKEFAGGATCFTGGILFSFYGNTWTSLCIKKERGRKKGKKSFYLHFFMLVSDSETIESLLFMYL